MAKIMEKVGIVPNLPIGQSPFPSSLQGSMSMINSSSSQNPLLSITQLQTRLSEQGSLNLPGYGNKSTGLSSETFVSKSTLTNAPFGSRTEQISSSFLQSPTLKGEESEPNVAGSLKSENSMLHMIFIIGNSTTLPRLLIWYIHYASAVSSIDNSTMLP